MRFFFAVPALVALAVVTACEGGNTTVVAGDASDAAGITVDGVGTAESAPDTGFVDIGIAIEAATVAEAREEAAASAASVIASIKDNGVEDRDVRTVNFSVEPRYEYPNNAAPRITGYTVSNTVSVKVRELQRLGEIIDEAIATGGDAVRVNGVRFDIDDRTPLSEQARERAMDDARTKAEQLASLAGVTLGAPISISEVAAPAPQPLYLDSAAYSQSAGIPTPIQPGSATTEVRLTVRWAIQ